MTSTKLPQHKSGQMTLRISIVLAGLFAGFFYTYTISVTRGLAEVGDVTYVQTFQAINDTIRNGWFAIVFFGATPAAAIALAANRNLPKNAKRLIGLGTILLTGTVIITFAGNVVLNNSLGQVDGALPDVAATARAKFEHSWNQLNAIRTLLSTGGFVALVSAGTLPISRKATPAS